MCISTFFYKHFKILVVVPLVVVAVKGFTNVVARFH
ncbi:hypothetical protein AAZX31_19G069800 [Glycine max]